MLNSLWKEQEHLYEGLGCSWFFIFMGKNARESWISNQLSFDLVIIGYHVLCAVGACLQACGPTFSCGLQ